MTLSSNRIIKLKSPIRKVSILSSAGTDGCSLSEFERALNEGGAAEPAVEIISIPQPDFDKEIEFAFQKGIEEGKLRGYQQAEMDYGQKVRDVMAVTEAFETEKVKFFREAEPVLLNLSVNLVRKILTDLPPLIPGFIKNSLEKILNVLSSEPVVEVYMHPEDIENYENLREVFEARMPNLDKLVIKPDDRMQKGGCVVSTDTGKIDARVKTQSEKLFQEIQKAMSEVSVEESE